MRCQHTAHSILSFLKNTNTKLRIAFAEYPLYNPTAPSLLFRRRIYSSNFLIHPPPISRRLTEGHKAEELGRVWRSGRAAHTAELPSPPAATGPPLSLGGFTQPTTAPAEKPRKGGSVHPPRAPTLARLPVTLGHGSGNGTGAES